MTKRRQRRSLPFAIALSLALHALLVLGVALSPSQVPARKDLRPSEFELVYLPAPAPKQDPAPNATSPFKGAVKKKKAAAKVVASPETVSPLPPEPLGADSPLADAPMETEEPKKVSLLPQWTLPPLDNKASPYSRSRTIRNDGLGPDEETKRQYEAEVLQRKLNEELQGHASRARIESGDVPRELNSLRDDLRDAVHGEREFLSHAQKTEPVKTAIKESVVAYLDVAEQYGKTGSPFSTPDQTRRLEEGPFARSALQHQPHMGDTHQQGNNNGMLQSMASIGAIMDRARGPKLRTVVELNQLPSGAVASARLLETSGNQDFDKFALETTLNVAERLALDGGAIPPWRSVWQFVFDPPKVKVDLIDARSRP